MPPHTLPCYNREKRKKRKRSLTKMGEKASQKKKQRWRDTKRNAK
jgi:hypothetical protein